MQYFVEKNSVVRKIWGKSDTVLFIFAGAAAEFALNKAVDWLYFTGKLPSNPIARLFSTVSYARRIVFSSMEEANKAIDTIHNIHTAVERSRGGSHTRLGVPGCIVHADTLFHCVVRAARKKIKRGRKKRSVQCFLSSWRKDGFERAATHLY